MLSMAAQKVLIVQAGILTLQVHLIIIPFNSWICLNALWVLLLHPSRPTASLNNYVAGWRWMLYAKNPFQASRNNMKETYDHEVLVIIYGNKDDNKEPG